MPVELLEFDCPLALAMRPFGNVERVSLVGRLRLSANPVLDIGECLLCGFAMFEFSEAMNSEYWPLCRVLPSLVAESCTDIANQAVT